MAQEDTGLEESMMQTLAKSDLTDLAVDLSEIALDSILEDGVLKDIPIIGSIVSVGKAMMSVRDRLFAKKILLFLFGLEKVSEQERQAQIDRLAADPKERRRVGEQLLLLLDRLNDMRKPELLARAFQALLEGKIDRVQFQSLAQAIDVINPDLIQVFADRRGKGFYQRTEPDADTAHFLQCGLVTFRFAKIDKRRIRDLDVSNQTFTGGVFRESELGALFYDILLKTKRPVLDSEKS